MKNRAEFCQVALLAAPGQSVQAAASAVGFESQSAYSRAFADFCGETPSAYRRRIAKQGHDAPEPGSR